VIGMAEAGIRPQRAQERVLEHVFGAVGTRHPASMGEQFVTVRFDEGPEGRKGYRGH
jgi:hypothetical protein